MIISSTSGSSGMTERLICVFAETGTPASRRLRIASSAAANEPCTPRCRSCVASRPSIETLALSRPACFAARARSGVMPRPPVVSSGSIPRSAMRAMISHQSSRR